MEIKEFKGDRRKYLDLLLLGDEDETMLNKYIDRGRMFILVDGEPRGQVLVEEEDICEIKNISVYEDFQRKGYASAMIEYLFEKYRGKYDYIYVGTGESPLTLNFYESLGFKYSHRLENFFRDNYKEDIIEAGVLLKDMVYLRKKL